MKKVMILYFMTMSCAYGQQKFFIDERDSTRYETFTIENHLWLKSNLKYKTLTSWCNEHPESEACISGNFYYATDLVNICPVGWRVPTWMDYKRAIKFIEKNRSAVDSVTYSEDIMPNKKYKILAEGIIGITLIGDTTFFDMTSTGWIQGNKWELQPDATMWIVEDIFNSPQPHVHVLKNGEIIKHAHEHNVIDKPKKIRRFSVRCISDVK